MLWMLVLDKGIFYYLSLYIAFDRARNWKNSQTKYFLVWYIINFVCWLLTLLILLAMPVMITTFIR